MNATFTDPNDTSAWFYQRWLLDKCIMTCKLWRAHINKNTAIIVIDNNILIKPVSISLFVNNEVIDVKWQLHPDEKFAKLRIAKLISPLESLNHNKEVFIKLQQTMYQLSYSNLENAWIYKDNLNLPKQNSNDEQLNEQLKSYIKLSEMEPYNKWALLTGILLMKKIDFEKFCMKILNDLTILSRIDCLRKNYYKDLRKYIFM
jgi:geranylgeranyl transferase type-2 subunit alpha